MGIETVGIVGAGTMGGGIGINLAQHGFRVLLTDARPEAADAAVTGAVAFWARAVEKGRMSPAQAEAAQARLVTVGSLRDLGQADLLIEQSSRISSLRLLTELSARVRRSPDCDQHQLPQGGRFGQARDQARAVPPRLPPTAARACGLTRLGQMVS